MAEKTYSLYNDTELLDQRLAVEIGDSYVALVAGVAGKVAGFEYFAAADDDLAETMEAISHDSSLLGRNYSETKVFYNLEESVLVPVGHFNSSVAAEFIDATFGSAASHRVNVENVNVSPGIVNVYRSNEQWQDIVGRHFRAVTRRHLYSRLVEQFLSTDQQLRIVFSNNSFILLAAKARQLKIVRRFTFNSDADVLYYLLNTCKQVDLDLSETTLHVAGFIEKDSTLYKLLRDYCGNLKPDNAASDALGEAQRDRYPHHYFTSFISLLT